MNSYHSHLRQLASTCEFAYTDKEINSQIILSCSSQHLRRKALKDTTMTLQALLDEARALEVSEKQAVDIESSGSTNAVLPQKSKMPEKKSIWFNCGESFSLFSLCARRSANSTCLALNSLEWSSVAKECRLTLLKWKQSNKQKHLPQ